MAFFTEVLVAFVPFTIMQGEGWMSERKVENSKEAATQTLGWRLPVALVLSWAYELTSQGIRRETSVDDRRD